MKDAMFDELVASVREGGAILRGEVPPARKTLVENTNVQQIHKDTDAATPTEQQPEQG
jgi:hypothetical protein